LKASLRYLSPLGLFLGLLEPGAIGFFNYPILQLVLQAEAEASQPRSGGGEGEG
jgi:hypothetical protein